jgi:hypothetical protein
MEKCRVLGIAVGLLVLVGLIAYTLTHPAPAKTPTTPMATQATKLPFPSGKYAEHAQYYDITAYVATSTPLTEPANTAALVLMQEFATDTIAQFKVDADLTSLTPKQIHTLGFDTGRKYALQILYLMSSSPRTISYIFTTYEDTGGAHGNTFFDTFTFDKTTGARLALADLFAPGAPYLKRLSEVSRAMLPDVIGQFTDAQMIENGTTPDEKNFESFFVDNGNLDILFPPYAVAAYAAGPQTLQIPLSSLSDILKPEYNK